ncbi:hypothetical protein HanRHA438_Chr02g0055371 [Helianthus annuus]|uniref:Uncharacterized protein n=1 Tax=Helianthus annuus TaxID=4232 RepID=A0A251TII2_HELAN|nr:hypothetical protein HanXRQr2_Chr02g0053981 [Helianthus annuus]KAJ0938932.1 hypothetical protein HanRHA438_Chr02g0055371 [Helianthus annuus]
MNSELFVWLLLIYLFGRSSPIQMRVFHLHIFILISLKKREQGLAEAGPPLVAESWRSHDGGRFL